MLSLKDQESLTEHVLRTRGCKAVAETRMQAFAQGVQAAVEVIARFVTIDGKVNLPGHTKEGESC